LADGGETSRQREQGVQGPSHRLREENPFSLRQFLAQGHGDPRGARNTGARPKTRPRAPSQEASDQPEGSALLPDNKSSSGLPDFLQDYMSPGFEENQHPSPSGALPFDLTSTNRPGPDPRGPSRDRPSAVEEEAGGNFPSLSLPDFLSDGVLASVDGPSSGSPADGNEPRREVSPNDGANVESLRNELATCRFLLDRERERYLLR
jgi:hypothetical protein